MAALVEVDDLAQVREAAEERAKARVVEARAAVDEEQRGLLPQHAAIGLKAQAFDVDEEADAGLDFDVHDGGAAPHVAR